MPRLRLALPGRILLAASSGVLLFLAGPPVGAWPLAFVALVPLLWSLERSSGWFGAVIGWSFGFTYFGLLIYWIALFGDLAWTALACLMATSAALFGLLAPAVVRTERPWLSAGGLASLWVAIELLMSSFPLGGFGWGAVAYTQADNPLTIRVAALTGAWGVSFIVVLCNALFVRLGEPGWGRRTAVAATIVGLAVAPGLLPLAEPDGETIDVAAVQITVPKDVALTPELRVRTVAERHFSAHRELAADPPDLVVWAEDSLDVDPTLDPVLGPAFEQAVKAVGAPVITGAIMGPDDGRQYNQNVLYDGQANILGRHSKVHLVPFGEYVPWRDRLSFLELLEQVPRDLTPGRVLEPLTLGEMRIANIICFENAFPEVARRQVADGADVMVVTTNNASYLTTAASRQHLNITRLRAVENGRWAVHGAISGISAFVDERGGVHDRTDLFATETIRREIRGSSARTPYNRFGDWFAWASVIASAALILAPRRKHAPSVPVDELPSSPRTLVILPTYNERQTIEQVVSRLLALPHRLDLLIVDDSSPDGTAAAVEAMGENRVRVLSRPNKSGLASAYLTGFEIAVDEGYDLAVEMDSDLSHDPDELPALLEGARDHHLIIGSRYVPGGSVTNWGVFRRLLSKAGNLYARVCLGFPLTDSTSGFRVYRRNLLDEEILHRGIHSEGYGFQIELAFRSWRDGWSVGERPITFREREHGHSKISRTIVLEALWEVTMWGVRERFSARPEQAQRP